MHPVLRLVRVGNLAVAFAGTVVAGFVAHPSPITSSVGVWIVILLAAVTTTLVTAGGNVLNDIFDRAADQLNHPERPLVTGQVSLRTARFLTVGLFVFGGLAIAPFALSLPLLPTIYLLAVGGLVAYEFVLKASGVAGNVVVAALTGAVFLFGGAAGRSIVSVVPFALMATLATFSREVIKDMEDVRGDVDRRTLPRMKGMGVAGGAARAAVAVAIVLSVVPVLTFLSPGSGAGIVYLALVAAADAMFVLSVVWLPQRLHWEQSMSKGAMAVALLAFLAAAFR